MARVRIAAVLEAADVQQGPAVQSRERRDRQDGEAAAVRTAADNATAESALAQQAANAEAVRQRAVQATRELANQERAIQERATTLRADVDSPKSKKGGKGKGGKRTKTEAFYDKIYDEKRQRQAHNQQGNWGYDTPPRKSQRTWANNGKSGKGAKW